VASVAELLADRYELEVRLGSGGMGDVYRARDRLLERPVAVKVPTTTLTPASAERFKREARAAARLNHPNVVGVYDWGGGTEPFIVMEFVEGRSLRAELRERGALPPAEVAAVGAQIADALAHAHHHGVVHRDVKPSNVLLTPGGSVKVTDFGIAQSAAGEALTEPGVVLGTVGYLSPEQVAGLPADTRSDVYSLGIVLNELLTGERPTGGEPAPATDLERIIARARAADPNARHQLAAELRDELRAVDLAAPAPSAPPAILPVPVPPRAAGPLTAVAVTVGTDADSNATARATGAGATAVLPAAAAAVTASSITTPPPRTPTPSPKRRRFRRTKNTFPKVAKPPKPVKPLKPPKPKKAKRAPSRPVMGPPPPPGVVTPKPARNWKARHWAVILAAPLLLVVGGAVAYAKLTEHAPIVAVPDVVDRDVFSAAKVLQDAGFEVDSRAADSWRPGGTILDQDPTNGKKLEQGSTVMLTVSRTRATVPSVLGMSIGDATATLEKRGFFNPTVTPDYRDDVDVGTVTRTNPGAGLQADKSVPIEVVVAADPHVELRQVVGVDQGTATNLLRGDGLVVAVQTASSKTRPAGTVLKSSPGAGTTVVRGDTITLTVSSGPRQVNVPPVVGKDSDDATSDLEDAGFAVQVETAPVTSGRQDGTVLAQSPAGGTAAEGSTVTITVGSHR